MIVRATKIKGGPPTWRLTEELNVGYTLSGRLVGTITKGQVLTIDRRERNGHAIHGLFTTSAITDIETRGRAKLVHTANSVWKIEAIDEPTTAS